jgi:hypothetical protein
MHPERLGGLDLSTFLVTWNPDSYTKLAKNWEKTGKEIAKSGFAYANWSMGNRKNGVEVGDRVFMVRQIRDRGMVLAGYFESEIYQELHWVEANAAKGKLANYADIRWEQQTEGSSA